MNKKLILFLIVVAVIIGVVVIGLRGKDSPWQKDAEPKKSKETIIRESSVWLAQDTSQYDELTGEERRQKIVDLTVQARTRIKKGQFDEALIMAQDLLILDPDNKEAQSMLERAKTRR